MYSHAYIHVVARPAPCHAREFAIGIIDAERLRGTIAHSVQLQILGTFLDSSRILPKLQPAHKTCNTTLSANGSLLMSAHRHLHGICHVHRILTCLLPITNDLELTNTSYMVSGAGLYGWCWCAAVRLCRSVLSAGGHAQHTAA